MVTTLYLWDWYNMHIYRAFTHSNDSRLEIHKIWWTQHTDLKFARIIALLTLMYDLMAYVFSNLITIEVQYRHLHVLTCAFRMILLLSVGHQTGTCSDLVDVVPMVSERRYTVDS